MIGFSELKCKSVSYVEIVKDYYTTNFIAILVGLG